MNDDFNTPQTIATLFELVTIINSINANNSVGEISKNTFLYLQKTMNGFIVDVLGFKSTSSSTDNSDKLIELMLEMRSEAKANKNYDLSDKIRDQLKNLGITIKDSKEGTTYSITK
jgi:cysteinyl-tRNA synthetase